MAFQNEDPLDFMVSPDVVGMAVSRAGQVMFRHGLVLIAQDQDPDDPPLVVQMADRPGATVLTQQPPAGEVLRRGESVTVTWDQGGAGVREPRRPRPMLLANGGCPGEERG